MSWGLICSRLVDTLQSPILSLSCNTVESQSLSCFKWKTSSILKSTSIYEVLLSERDCCGGPVRGKSKIPGVKCLPIKPGLVLISVGIWASYRTSLPLLLICRMALIRQPIKVVIQIKWDNALTVLSSPSDTQVTRMPKTNCVLQKFVCWNIIPILMVFGDRNLWKAIRSWGY